MKVSKSEKGLDIILSPKERDDLHISNKKIESLTSSQIELIDRTFENILSTSGIDNSSNITGGLLESLSLIIGAEAAELIVNMSINYTDTNKFLEQLKEEQLLSQKSISILEKIPVKYGYTLRKLYQKTQLRTHWISISTNTVIKKKSPMMKTEIILGNGELLEFESDLNDGLSLASHFIESMISVINEIDKELVMDIDEKEMEVLNKYLDDLKKRREEIQQKIKNIENSPN